jgi:hypothetical protein
MVEHMSEGKAYEAARAELVRQLAAALSPTRASSIVAALEEMMVAAVDAALGRANDGEGC